MHVGVYLNDYLPTVGGGYTFQREIIEAVVELAGQSKHRFSFLARTSANLVKNKINFGTIELIPVRQPRSVFTDLDRIFQRFRKIRNPSTRINIQSPLDFTAMEHDLEFIWFVTPAYEMTGIPYIATVWDLQHRLQPWFPEVGRLTEWNARETSMSIFLKRATYVIAANDAGRKEINQFYQVPKARIVCLNHPTPTLCPASPEEVEQTIVKYGLKPGFLFYPAQYWAHKNHANLLFALKVLKDDYLVTPSAVFVGSDKGNLPYLKNLASDLGIESQVHFLGFVDDMEMTALYKSAFALIYLSFFGPENLPPLEAFSVGCPVIAARVDGATEQFEGAALLIRPTDAGEIAAAIKSLMDDPSKKSLLVERGLERAKKANSSEYVRQIFALLDEFEPVRRTWGKMPR